MLSYPNVPNAQQLNPHHGSNSWMILSKRITAKRRLEKPATHANANIAKVRSVDTPEGEFSAVFTGAPAFFAMLSCLRCRRNAIDLETKCSKKNE